MWTTPAGEKQHSETLVSNPVELRRALDNCVTEHKSCEAAVLRRDSSGLLWPISFITVPEDFEERAEDQP